jgi:predicted component of type VI protein secretion system
MYMLQLFDADDAIQPIDARLLRDGTLRIGRDPSADWPIADPECALSRAHCEISADPLGLALKALGANGVFDDLSGTRFPDGQQVALPLPGTLRLGRFRIVATAAPHDQVEGGEGRTMVLSLPLGASTAVPTDWNDAALPPPATGGSLLEAFCQGAGIDSSYLSSDDPEEIMRRAGAVYRQMVLGVADLMAERDRARGRYQLSRTTIKSADNNPFKWAPSQRLAVDLLLGSAGFLAGPAALNASFRDLKRHLVATFTGLQGALRAAVDAFDPARVDAAVTGKGSLLKSRAALQMQEVTERHADLSRQLDEGAQGSLDRAFVRAYDAADVSLRREPRG